MTDNKYTNEDIISSLEVIATTCNCNECKIRSGRWGTCNCSETTANAALDLINRQKAEIERLRGSTIVNNIMESQRIKREAKAEALSVAEKTSLILTAGAIIAVGIYAIVKAVDHFNVSQKEAIDLAKEAQSTLKDTQGELSSVKDRLKEVKDEIEQINSKGGLTLTDEAKINQLKRESVNSNASSF